MKGPDNHLRSRVGGRNTMVQFTSRLKEIDAASSFKGGRRPIRFAQYGKITKDTKTEEFFTEANEGFSNDESSQRRQPLRYLRCLL
jgi:hypothetical protein